MKRFGVIGHPVGHSLSPLMHATAYSLLGLECSYEAFDVDPGVLSESLKEFSRRGFSGLNVTIPHKEHVAAQMDELSEEAKVVGAVNTVLFQKDRLRGENTDVFGVEASLRPYESLFNRQRALLLGAGGTSRAIVYALLTRFSPSEVVIANRHQERAVEMAAHFAPFAKAITLKAAAADEATLHSLVDNSRLIVNATSIGMSPAIDASPLAEETQFHSNQVVFDLIYTPSVTRLLAMAERGGARTISGLEMFLHQGARSFELWLGARMPVAEIRPVIEHELKIRQQH